jgi:hypothetical protein
MLHFYQHDGEPPDSSRFIRQYLNLQLPKPCISRGIAKNWPGRLRHASQLCHSIWVYMKEILNTRKMNTREEVLCQFIRASRLKNNTEEIRKLTFSITTRASKYIRADEGRFYQLLPVDSYVTALHIYL